MRSSDIPPRGSGIVYCFDLDGTICTTVEMSNYDTALPDMVVVEEINRLYENGSIIKIMTARGSVSGVDHTELTKSQLEQWGINYHELIMNKKPYADFFIDDRAIHIDDWKKLINPTRGIVAGAFDVIHLGYVLMFEEACKFCDHLTVALHIDPSIENGKSKPINTVDERKNILLSIKYINNVVVYETEDQLYDILNSGSYDIRFLGDDYKDKKYTGDDLPIPIIWISRDHGYSTTNLKNRIKESL